MTGIGQNLFHLDRDRLKRNRMRENKIMKQRRNVQEYRFISINLQSLFFVMRNSKFFQKGFEFYRISTVSFAVVICPLSNSRARRTQNQDTIFTKNALYS